VAELMQDHGAQESRFFNDPFVINPQTGRLLDPQTPGGAICKN
jgi:hypothetical protein